MKKKRTRVSSSEEEKSTHVLVDDAILKDLQAKLDKLNVLDQINERLIRIENDLGTVHFLRGRGGWWDLGGGSSKKKNALKGGPSKKIREKGGVT